MSLETSRYCSNSFYCKRPQLSLSLQEMPLLYTIVTFLLVGSSTALELKEICYGRTYTLPMRFTPPSFMGKLHFTPDKGGSSKLVMENGEAKDPRIKVSTRRVSFRDVEEKYGGIFSFSYRDEGLYAVKVKVLPCSEDVEKYYGDDWYYDTPEQSELLDFSPNFRDQSQILWNSTNPLSNKRGRGRMRHHTWEMLRVTQSDSGFYYFRKQGGAVLHIVRLFVEGYQEYHDVTVNKPFFIDYPGSGDSWTLTFTTVQPNHTMTLVKAGNLAGEKLYLRHHRIQVYPGGIEINSVETGRYDLIDSQGNVAKTVWVDVNYGIASTFVYVGIVVGIILVVIVCCCCVKKCCCKKSSTKRDGSAPQTAAVPAVYYHNVDQPEVFSSAPTTNYSDQPVVSPAPATTSSGPSVVASGGQGVTPAPSAGSDFLSSDPGPRFELKGMSFPSASPLSSDTSHLSDVYNSDKLNFL